jgi:hypothetical protein
MSSESGEQRHPGSRPVGRRELFSTAASGLLGFVAACGPGNGRTEITRTADGRILQWQRDDLLVLVSGLQESYRLGQELRLSVMLNNQASRSGSYRVRTRLIGRGQQVVAETPVATLQVEPLDAAEIERSIELTPAVGSGDFTLSIELPPWSLDGRTVGGGALSAPLRIDR